MDGMQMGGVPDGMRTPTQLGAASIRQQQPAEATQAQPALTKTQQSLVRSILSLQKPDPKPSSLGDKLEIGFLAVITGIIPGILVAGYMWNESRKETNKMNQLKDQLKQHGFNDGDIQNAVQRMKNEDDMQVKIKGLITKQSDSIPKIASIQSKIESIQMLKAQVASIKEGLESPRTRQQARAEFSRLLPQLEPYLKDPKAQTTQQRPGYYSEGQEKDDFNTELNTTLRKGIASEAVFGRIETNLNNEIGRLGREKLGETDKLEYAGVEQRELQEKLTRSRQTPAHIRA